MLMKKQKSDISRVLLYCLHKTLGKKQVPPAFVYGEPAFIQTNSSEDRIDSS